MSGAMSELDELKKAASEFFALREDLNRLVKKYCGPDLRDAEIARLRKIEAEHENIMDSICRINR